jgi:hypothetical protein
VGAPGKIRFSLDAGWLELDTYLNDSFGSPPGIGHCPATNLLLKPTQILNAAGKPPGSAPIHPGKNVG